MPEYSYEPIVSNISTHPLALANQQYENADWSTLVFLTSTHPPTNNSPSKPAGLNTYCHYLPLSSR